MKKVTKNLIWGFGGQLLTLAMNFILPRLILISYGSEINGLTSTITQIFTYIALLETIFYKGIMPSEKVLDFPVDCNTLTGSVNL